MDLGKAGRRRIRAEGAPEDTPPRRIRSQWSGWEAASGCLGAPWGEPPAGDPGAFRNLAAVGPVAIDPPRGQPRSERETGLRWRLVYSGENRCRIAGEVWLAVARDEADLSGLSADGLAWGNGGRERARLLQVIWIQDNAVSAWRSGETADRVLLLRALATSPDDGADAALQDLLAIAGAMAPDVERAIAQRTEASPAPQAEPPTP